MLPFSTDRLTIVGFGQVELGNSGEDMGNVRFEQFKQMTRQQLRGTRLVGLM